MKDSFIKGVLVALAYYSAGALLAFLTYKIFGQGYIHAPGLHHFILLVTWAGGFLWALVSIYKRFTASDPSFYRGTALVNIAVVAVGFLWVYRQMGASESADATANQGPESITTEFSGDTATVRHDGTIVFLRIGDSVYLDELRKIYPPDSVLNQP